MAMTMSINQSINPGLSSISQSKDSVRDALAVRTSKTMPPTQLSQIKLPRRVKHMQAISRKTSPKNKLTTEERNEF